MVIDLMMWENHANHRLTIKKLLHTFNNRISYSLECMTCNEILIDVDIDEGFLKKD